MYATKFFVPAFAVLGFASAQASFSLCASATATVTSQAQATGFGTGCSTFSGSIVVASTVRDTISFDGLKQLGGDLIVNGAVNLTSLSAPSLNAIGGEFSLTSLTIMSTLAFPALTSVKSIRWTTLNALQSLTFGTPGVQKASSVVISDTALTTLDGINLNTVQTLDINNNVYLQIFSTQIANITTSLNLNANGQNLAVQFPNLIWAYNMTMRNISSISIPSLASVNGTFGIYGSFIESINAPNLTAIGGDLAFVANNKLSNITLPVLKTVGASLQIANNSALLDVSGFPKLTTVGTINMSGNFTNFVLPSLTDDKGAFYAVSSGNFSCSPFNAYASSSPKVIKGVYTCTPASNNVQEAGSSTSSGGSSSTTSKAAASGLVTVNLSGLLATTCVVGFFSIVGGIFQLAM